MKNLFQRASFRRRGKYNGAKCASIQLAVRVKNLIAEFAANFTQHGGVAPRQLARHFVRVEEMPGRQKFLQTINEARFSGGDSASDSYRRHGRDYSDEGLVTSDKCRHSTSEQFCPIARRAIN
jgi:hypothetical protein